MCQIQTDQEDVGETGDTDEERCLGSSGIVNLHVGNGSLDRGKDGTTSDTHDKETGGSSSVSSETGRTEDEDDGVHDRFETHDGDQADNTTGAVKGTNEDDHDESADGASSEKDGGGNKGKKSDTNESTDSEGDETVREEFSTLSVVDAGDDVRVEQEEGTNGNLSTDVEELSDETGDGSDLLPEWLVETRVDTLSVGKSLSFGLESLLGNFGELGEEEGESDSDTETSDGHVDVLDSSEITRVFTAEEVLGGDQGTGERSNTVETLRELESKTSDFVRGHDSDVRVGRDLEGGETTSNDSSADNESSEDGARVSRADRVVSDRPEEDSTKRVESETGDDGDLVALSLQNLGSDRRVSEVTDTEVSSLKTGRLSLGDAESGSEVRVQDIKETVGETPKEEKRGD